MSEQLRAGAATANITPWLGIAMRGAFRDVTHCADAVHDDLLAKALVLDDGVAADRVRALRPDHDAPHHDGCGERTHCRALQHPGRPRAHCLDPHPLCARHCNHRVHGGADRIYSLGHAQDCRRRGSGRAAFTAGPHRLCQRFGAAHRLQPPLPHAKRTGALQSRRRQRGRNQARRHYRSRVHALLRRGQRRSAARRAGELRAALRGHGYWCGDIRRLLWTFLPRHPTPARPANGGTALQRRFRQYQ